jgi:hypothetical protein
VTTEQAFFWMGCANNLLLIALFLLRKTGDMTGVRRVGGAYLLLAIPAAYVLYQATAEQAAWQYLMFLGIFLAFLALAWLYDFVLEVPFRQNWKLLTPYLMLYYAMNYGFVVMVWQDSLTRGIFMLALFGVQIIANILSHHPKKIVPAA